MKNLITYFDNIKNLELDISITIDVMQEIQEMKHQYTLNLNRPIVDNYLDNLLLEQKNQLKILCTNTSDYLFEIKESINDNSFLIFNNYIMHVYNKL
jgi:hypothetical protein